MKRDDVRAAFQDLTVWSRGSERAPHKPLLLLYALGRCARGEDRLISYEELEEDVERLLFEFGPARKSYHPEYPFWRLQKDDVWEVPGFELREGRTDPSVTRLREEGAAGGLKPAIHDALSDDPDLLRDVARLLLEAHFPAATYHADICDAVGLGELVPTAQPGRDPDFRPQVLTAYEHRCAVCGFDVRLGHVLVAVEAAHIKWHQAGGPSEVANGLALCSMHHKLFDRGAFTLSDQRVVTVSERAHGGSGFDDWLLRFHGQRMRRPVNEAYLPVSRYLEWHREEVFRGGGRP